MSDYETKATLFAAGAAGSILSFRFVPGMNKKQKLLAIGSGAVMSMLLAPLAAWVWNIENNHEAVAGIGFGIGIFGLAVCDSLFQKITSGDWLNFISGRQ